MGEKWDGEDPDVIVVPQREVIFSRRVRLSLDELPRLKPTVILDDIHAEQKEGAVDRELKTRLAGRWFPEWKREQSVHHLEYWNPNADAEDALELLERLRDCDGFHWDMITSTNRDDFRVSLYSLRENKQLETIIKRTLPEAVCALAVRLMEEKP